MIAAHSGMFSGNRGQIGRSVGDGLQARLFIDGDGNDCGPSCAPRSFVLQRNLLINQQYILHPHLKGGIAFLQIVPYTLGMQRRFGQDSLHRGFGRPAQRRMARLQRFAPNMLRQ